MSWLRLEIEDEMAIARCDKCGRPKGKSGNVYSETSYHPTNHPHSGVVCGTEGCDGPAMIWLLKPEEEDQYRNGGRVFEITGSARYAKFRVA